MLEEFLVRFPSIVSSSNGMCNRLELSAADDQLLNVDFLSIPILSGKSLLLFKE